MHSYVYSSIIYNSQDMEAAQVSINWWMDKEVVYIYNGTLFSHKKEKMPFVMTWVELKSRILSEISHPEKDKYHMMSLIWVI